MPAEPGPTANLPATVRRLGRSGKAFINGEYRGEVTAVEWTTEIAQVAVPIAGQWRSETVPGEELRRGTFRYQDIDDHFALMLWDFIQRRRRGQSCQFPEFSLVTVLDHCGSPQASRWQLDGCQLYQLERGYATETDLIVRDTPFTYRDERPLDAFEYTKDGVAVRQG